MTQPQSQGFPDYQRNRPAQNVVYESFNQAINGVVQRGPFFCGYFPATRFKVSAVNQNTTWIVNWFADKAGTVLLGSGSFTTQANDNVDISLANQGPWFTYSMIPNATPDTITSVVSAVAYIGGPGLQETNNVLISSENTAIGIGGTLSIFATQIWPGPATLSFNVNQRPYTVSLAGTQLGGTRLPFFQWNEATEASRCMQVFLPASIVRIIVGNSSGVAATGSCFLTADPWPRPAGA